MSFPYQDGPQKRAIFFGQIMPDICVWLVKLLSSLKSLVAAKLRELCISLELKRLKHGFKVIVKLTIRRD